MGLIFLFDQCFLLLMITIRQLRYFEALARQRHFGRAAEACAVTQPALSMQIRELEAQLGAVLVERRPGQVILTDVGQEVRRRGEVILAGIRDLEDYARHSGRLLAGRLQLGVIPSLAPYMLPKILPLLHAHFPDLRLELRETQTHVLLEELTRGDLDLAMIALPALSAELDTLALFDDPFLYAVPIDEAPPEDTPLNTADIDQRRLILLEEGHCLRDQALALCGAPAPDSAIGLGATSLATVMQMVANGYGVTLLPEVAAEVELRGKRVRLMRFAEPEPRRTIGLAWRRSSVRKADYVALGEVIMELFARAQTSKDDASLGLSA